jgi:hypothetical protein
MKKRTLYLYIDGLKQCCEELEKEVASLQKKLEVIRAHRDKLYEVGYKDGMADRS